MHSALRFLPDRNRQAEVAGPRRATPGGRIRRVDGSALRHGDRSRPRRPADGGAWLYAETCRQIHLAVSGCGVELLIPDFNADEERLALVFVARPEVLAHNIETVPRTFRRIRPAFRYRRSLEVLTRARSAGASLAVEAPVADLARRTVGERTRLAHAALTGLLNKADQANDQADAR